MAAALIGCASACSAVGRGAARLPRNSEVEITQLSPSSPLCAYGCQAGTGGACGTWPWLRQAVLALQSYRSLVASRFASPETSEKKHKSIWKQI